EPLIVPPPARGERVAPKAPGEGRKLPRVAPLIRRFAAPSPRTRGEGFELPAAERRRFVAPASSPAGRGRRDAARPAAGTAALLAAPPHVGDAGGFDDSHPAGGRPGN